MWLVVNTAIARQGHNMKVGLFVFLTLIVTMGVEAEKEEAHLLLPIKDGEYVFKHKFAEAGQSSIESIELLVTIKDNHIVLINNDRYGVFPKGVIDEGPLVWHSKSGQWIISTLPADKNAPDVGGCSDGPSVIDLVNRIYWTC